MVTRPVSSTEPVFGPWHILLVTDSPIERKLLTGLLAKHAHRVFTATSAREAVLDWAENRFDVVLLDAMLTEMDGAEIAKGIRHHERGNGRSKRPVPIVVLAEHEQDRERCRRAGVDLCLRRPLEVTEFNVRIQDLLTRRIDQSPEVVDRVDWHVAFDAVGGRRELLQELVEIFIVEYPKVLQAIDQAIQQGNAKGLQLSAHQLKGCLRYFGTTSASELARELEDMGRASHLEGAASRLPSLAAAVERLIPLLRAGP